MKRVSFSKAALRTLGRLPSNVAGLIRLKIDQYASDPTSLANNIKVLRNRDGASRLRVGDWRIIFNESGEVIAVTRIAPRGGAYE